MAIITNAKMHFFFYSKNNKIIIKFNNIVLAKKVKKQVFKKVAYIINVYFIEKKIIFNKFYITQTLLNKNIAI